MACLGTVTRLLDTDASTSPSPFSCKSATATGKILCAATRCGVDKKPTCRH